MIHIFFVPGMYGHMIDYAINRFAYKDPRFRPQNPASDGSMHRTDLPRVYAHHHSINDFKSCDFSDTRTTVPYYPLLDAKFYEVMQAVSNQCQTWALDKKILMTSMSLDSARLNLFFQYHKIADGVFFKAGMELFYGGAPDLSFKAWNSDYTSFSCMRRWELREWFSLAWKGLVKEWMIDPLPGSDWLVLDNKEFIHDITKKMHLIFSHCDLLWDPALESFLEDYRSAQYYILEEFALVDKICDNVINQQNFCWEECNVIAESLIQSKLRDQGYEIRCQDLDRFPTDIATLSNLLYSPEVTS